MKKALVYTLISVFVILLCEDAFSQRRRGTRQKKYTSRAFRKKQSRISNYSGGRTGNFGRPNKYSSIGVSVNAFNYFGDIAPVPDRFALDISFTRPGFGAVYSKHLSSRFAVRGSLTWGRIFADDQSVSIDRGDGENSPRAIRNIEFRNSIIELGITGQLFILPEGVTFNPYIMGGVGIIRHNPQGRVPEFQRADNGLAGAPFTNAGEWIDLEPLGTEGQFLESGPAPNSSSYNLTEIVIPLGIGVKYYLSQNLDLAFEIGYRHTFTDYLDDVSGGYANFYDFEDPLARALSDPSYIVGNTEGNEVGFVQTARSDGLGNVNVVPGYGTIREPVVSGDPGNIRGNPDDNDVYIVTSIQLTYVLPGSTRRAKFR
ncbi:MAG: DUF6089 family protein [Bacteroidota bacterium]